MCPTTFMVFLASSKTTMADLKCILCNIYSTNIDAYISHLKKVHKLKTNLRCCICTKEVNTYEGLKKHMRKCVGSMTPNEQFCAELSADVNNLRLDCEGKCLLCFVFRK